MGGNPGAKKPSETADALASGREDQFHCLEAVKTNGEFDAPPLKEQEQREMNSVPERNRSISIRMSGRNLPGQIFWDWLSGVPLSRQHAWFSRTPLMHVLDSVGGLFAAMSLAYVAIRLNGWWLLLLVLALPLIVGRARKCHMTIVHQAVHDQLFQTRNYRHGKLANRLLAETIGVLIWIPDFQTYRKAHAISHHNPEETATPKDLDGKIVFTMRYGDSRNDCKVHCEEVDDMATTRDLSGKEVFALGFMPGMPREYYRRLLRRIILSPRFYLADFWQRFRFSLFGAPWYRRVASALFSLCIVALTWFYDGWEALILIYILPIFPLFKLCGLLQQLSEHMWGTHMELVGSRERLPLICQGRFLFDEVPSAELPWGVRLRATIRWWLRVPYHLLVRICVLGGDLPAHHDHHFHPRAGDWVSATHACLARMKSDAKQRYSHAWSLGEALDRVFTEMSCAPPLERKWLDELR